MGKAVRASALVVLLACSTHAGYIPYGSPEPPPPAPASTTEEGQTPEGYIPNGEPDGLAEAVLSVVGTVLALL